jgi:hypothetical protein
MLDDNKKAVDHIKHTYPSNITSSAWSTFWQSLQKDSSQAHCQSRSVPHELRSKDRWGNVTQYSEPIFGEPTAPEVKDNEEVEDPFPTHANYAKMLQDHRTVTDNNQIRWRHDLAPSTSGSSFILVEINYSFIYREKNLF